MTRRNRSAEPIDMTVDVESLSNDARGVARHAGKTVFVDGALPGEKVRCRTVRRRSKYDSAIVTEVLQAAPTRVTPRCDAFGRCGGCSLQHMAADAQIQAKQQVLLDNLRHIGGLTPAALLAPLTADSWGYRRKARLGVRVVPKKGGVLVGFRERHSSYIAVMQHCEILDPRFAQLITPLRELIGQLSIANRIPQVEVAAGDDTACLVFRHLLPFTAQDIDRLAEFGRRHDVAVLLQPKGPDSVTDLDGEQPGLLSYRLPEWNLDMCFRATDFTQVNASINRQMISLALGLLDAQPGESVLDLFCGIGNFTLPLARQGASVTGIEGDAGLVAMARENAASNALTEAAFITADLYQEPLEGSWLRKPYDRILLDPPRSGAMEVVKQLPSLHARRIVYVSCNPATLARDAQLLVNKAGYRLQAAGVMDMFPHTTHVESIAVFDAP